MPTFKKRRVEVVDARQFTGGVQNGTDLAFWVNSNNGGAKWIEPRGSYPERVMIHIGPHSWHNAYVGDWIMYNQDGSFKAIRPQDLAAEYEYAS